MVRFEENRVEVSLNYLRQFQAGTGLHLAVYVDSTRYSRTSLTDVPEHEREHEMLGPFVRWRRDIADCHFKKEFETISRLLGKVLLPPPPREHAGVWPFADDDESEQDVAFIVGIDSVGNPVESTSNPKKLANFFGVNPGACNYMTPVYFRREVLQKYYSEPERYSVVDGRVSCLSLWICRIDNDLDSHVVVFLGQ